MTDQVNQRIPDPAEGHEDHLSDRLDERVGKAEDALGIRTGDVESQANGIDLYDKRALHGSTEEVADLASEALSDSAPEQTERQEEK